MIVSAVRAFKWTPDYIDTLFLDKFDYYGLMYWYEDIKEQNEQLAKKK